MNGESLLQVLRFPILILIVCAFLAACTVDRQSSTVSQTVQSPPCDALMTGDTLVLNDSFPNIRMPNEIIGDVLDTSSLVIIGYLNTDCSGCVAKLSEWEKVHDLFHSKWGVPVFLVVHGVSPGLISYRIREAAYVKPAFVDAEGIFLVENGLGADPICHGFLINRNRRVLALGNPVEDPAVLRLYDQQIKTLLNK